MQSQLSFNPSKVPASEKHPNFWVEAIAVSAPCWGLTHEAHATGYPMGV